MDGTRCPECENDLTDATTAMLVELLKARRLGMSPMTCPHCGTELSVNASVTAAIARQG